MAYVTISTNQIVLSILILITPAKEISAGQKGRGSQVSQPFSRADFSFGWENVPGRKSGNLADGLKPVLNYLRV
jgi:hypothetical protein